MTDLDTRLGPKVLSLILKYGKDATVRVPAGQVYNKATGSVASTTTNYVVKITPPEAYTISLENSTTVQQGDMTCLLGALNLAFTPRIGQVIIFDSQEWRVLEVKPYYSGELVVAWEFHLRK